MNDIDTYRGYKIYYLTAVPIYALVDPDGVEMSKMFGSVEECYTAIDGWVGEIPDSNGTPALGGLGLLILLYLIFIRGGK